MAHHQRLSRRERQIMDVLYRLGRATAADVQAHLPDGPGYSTVRTQLRVLEQKGHVRHEEVGLRYVYAPTVPRAAARKAALLGADGDLSADDLDRLESLIAEARRQAR